MYCSMYGCTLLMVAMLLLRRSPNTPYSNSFVAPIATNPQLVYPTQRCHSKCSMYQIGNAVLCRSKSTLPSKLLSIFKKYIWKWHHNHRQESQKACGPLIAKRVVHLHAKKRKSSCPIIINQPLVDIKL